MLKLAHKTHGRAVARVGELVAAIEPARGANQNIKDTDDPKVMTRKQAAEEAGLSERQAKQALRMANVPEDTREAVVT